MPDSKRFDPAEWFSFALNDLAAANILSADPDQANNTIWHCQQAVEKAIKVSWQKESRSALPTTCSSYPSLTLQLPYWTMRKSS
jgi:hypothetical protein